jgi:hypothetical protein
MLADREPERAYRDASGELVLRRVTPQLYTTTVKGAGCEAMVHWYVREFHVFTEAAVRKLDIFHDWGGVTTFTPEARRVFSTWAKERREQNPRVCRGVHTLVETTLAYLALEASGGFGRGYLQAYRDRQRFELEKDRAMRSPSSDPVVRGVVASAGGAS